MTLQYGTAVRNARLDAIETAIGPSPILRMRTGAPPANCGAADVGTVLSTIALPADWMLPAAAAVKTMNGTWQDAAADADGTPTHFRIYDNADTACHMQGTVTLTGGGGDMQVDDTAFVAGRRFTITLFTLTAGNP